MSKDLKVLAVDDNPDGLFALEQLLKAQGFNVITASSGKETLEKAEKESPDLILLDVMMPEPNGYECASILKRHPTLKYVPVVLLTGRDELQDIVHGLEQGADDYICKPFEKDELIARIHSILRVRELYGKLQKAHKQNTELHARLRDRVKFGNMIGQSKAMQELYAMLERVVDSDVPVLISGESGTGKELVATAIHANGSRKDKPFVVQNCSAFNENLLESELFGHVRGAFSGAVRDKEGLFEVADTGTFFLDELGEMSPALQVKLLRVLQDGSFMPVGGTKQKRVDVRIIAATHRNLEEMVSKGTFREDLYYRLNVINLRIPALRERQGDVPLLVEFFLEGNAAKSGKKKKSISSSAMDLLEAHAWPGNIRQLENEIQRAVVMSGEDGVIEPTHLSLNPPKGRVVASETPIGKLKDATEGLERRMIEDALKNCAGNKSEAARQLGISRSSLIQKAQAYGLADGEE